jgi:hypothetical protein
MDGSPRNDKTAALQRGVNGFASRAAATQRLDFDRMQRAIGQRIF